jgi:hypothetical protein
LLELLVHQPATEVDVDPRAACLPGGRGLGVVRALGVVLAQQVFAVVVAVRRVDYPA